MQNMLQSTQSYLVTKEYALTALTKLSTRFTTTIRYSRIFYISRFPLFVGKCGEIDRLESGMKLIRTFRLNFCFVLHCSRIENVVSSFGTHLNVELQQRGIEYAQLFTKHVNLRSGIMAHIPPMEHRPQAIDGGMTNGNGDNTGKNGLGALINGDDMLLDDFNPLGGRSDVHSVPNKDSVSVGHFHLNYMAKT